MSIKIEKQLRPGPTFGNLSPGEFFQITPPNPFLYLKIRAEHAFCFDGRSGEVDASRLTIAAETLVHRVTVTSITGKAWE